MSIQLTDVQKTILNMLISKYEGSKTYSGENLIKQNFYISPKEVFFDYDSDFSDLDKERDFETDVLELEKNGYVEIYYKKKTINKILLRKDGIYSIYSILGREEKKKISDSQLSLYKEFLGKNLIIDSFCNEQIDRISIGKKPTYENEFARNILMLLEFILSNQDYVLEREMSIAVLKDTKLFEKKYRKSIYKILLKYGDYDEMINNLDNETEQMHVLFEEYNVYANPSYIYFKGNARINYVDGTYHEISLAHPAAIPSDGIANIDKIIINDDRIMTIENLTSYNRLSLPGVFHIFLSGYHNTAKQLFLKKIAIDNDKCSWSHFGDLDPDGFMIFENLKNKTAINIEPAFMELGMLMRYIDYGKKLETNDIVKANTLIDNNLHSEIMKYMLEHNIKLEQEVISWLYMKL